jgi:hypothetical protein
MHKGIFFFIRWCYALLFLESSSIQALAYFIIFRICSNMFSLPHKPWHQKALKKTWFCSLEFLYLILPSFSPNFSPRFFTFSSFPDLKNSCLYLEDREERDKTEWIFLSCFFRIFAIRNQHRQSHIVEFLIFSLLTIHIWAAGNMTKQAIKKSMQVAIAIPRNTDILSMNCE